MITKRGAWVATRAVAALILVGGAALLSALVLVAAITVMWEAGAWWVIIMALAALWLLVATHESSNPRGLPPAHKNDPWRYVDTDLHSNLSHGETSAKWPS